VPGFTAATSVISAERLTVLPFTPSSTSPGLMPASGGFFSTCVTSDRAGGRGRRTAPATASLGSSRRGGRLTPPCATALLTWLATSMEPQRDARLPLRE
jgi:hypothetical protein